MGETGKTYVVPPEQCRKWQLAQLEGYEQLSRAYESGDPAAIAKAQADFDAAMINAVPEALPEEVRKQFQAGWQKVSGELSEGWQRIQTQEASQAGFSQADFDRSRAESYRDEAEHLRVLMAWSEAQQSGDPLQQKYEKEFHESVSKGGYKAGEFSEMMKKWYAEHEKGK